MTALKRKIIPAEELNKLMDDKLHENDEFSEFSFLMPHKNAIRHQGDDENWGFSFISCLHLSSNTEIDENIKESARKVSEKIWAEFASKYDIE